MRRGSIIQLVLIGIGAGAIATAAAIFIPWLPTPATRQAGRIDFAYWFATVICLFIFAVVSAILIYAMINFRVKDPNDFSDGPPVHGHTTIERFVEVALIRSCSACLSCRSCAASA